MYAIILDPDNPASRMMVERVFDTMPEVFAFEEQYLQHRAHTVVRLVPYGAEA